MAGNEGRASSAALSGDGIPIGAVLTGLCTKPQRGSDVFKEAA